MKKKLAAVFVLGALAGAGGLAFLQFMGAEYVYQPDDEPGERPW